MASGGGGGGYAGGGGGYAVTSGGGGCIVVLPVVVVVVVLPVGLSQLCSFFDQLCYSFMLHLLPIMLQKCTNCAPRKIIMLQKNGCGSL